MRFSFDASSLAESVGPIVSKYADQIDAKNAEKADLFKRVSLA